jgi:hypothetical protein
VARYNEKTCFGKIAFNTMGEEPEVKLEIFSVDNENMFSLTINADELNL